MPVSSKTYRIAVIGLGLRLSFLIIAMKNAGWRLDVVGYADPGTAGAERIAENGIDPGIAFASPEALLNAGPYDLVMIGSPNHLHLDHLRLALASTSPVFCEKPIVRTEEETMEIASLLSQRDTSKPPLYIGLVLRSMPLVRSFVERALSGEIGKLISMDATEHLMPDHGAYIAQNWRRRSEWGGSFMLDKACHDFDIFGLLAGARAGRVASLGGRSIFVPERSGQAVSGDGQPAYQPFPLGWSAADTPFDGDMDITDNQVAIVEYQNGFRLSFHSNTHSGIVERRWFLVGTEGVLYADLTHNVIRSRHAMSAGEVEVTSFGALDPLTHNGADLAMAKDLMAALEGEAPFPVTPWESMEAGLTVMAIDRACGTRDMVDCTPIWNALDKASERSVAA
jgi:predicted dehydrogenase